MKLTDAFLGEHGAFYMLLDRIEETAAIAGDIAQIDTAVAILTVEVGSHADLEEELLFPALEPHLATNQLLVEIRAEHEAIRRGLERIEDARSVGEAVEAVEQVVSMVRSHLQKEEKILYALAQRELDDETLIRLGEAWAAARSMTIE